MNTVPERKDYKRLSFSNIIFDNELISTEDSLKDIIPIHWSNDVLNGIKKVIIKKQSRL